MYILFVVGVVGEIYVAVGPVVTGNDVITFVILNIPFWMHAESTLGKCLFVEVTSSLLWAKIHCTFGII